MAFPQGGSGVGGGAAAAGARVQRLPGGCSRRGESVPLSAEPLLYHGGQGAKYSPGREVFYAR